MSWRYKLLYVLIKYGRTNKVIIKVHFKHKTFIS